MRASERCGLVVYDTANLGDDIQSAGVAAALPSGVTTRPLLRDEIAVYDGGEIRAVLNGWWMHAPFRFPPPPTVHPLFVGLHLTVPFRQVAAEHLADWRRWAPIGCRDRNTTDWFRSRDVDAVTTGCCSLLLPGRGASRPGPTVVVDCENSGELPPEIAESALVSTHALQGERRHDPDSRRSRLAEQFDLYARAELVVTSRLHAALPCAAMGTPVVFVKSSNEAERRSGRLLAAEGVLRRYERIADVDDWTPRLHLATPPPGRTARLRQVIHDFVLTGENRLGSLEWDDATVQ